jgi:hypothetical protein
VAHHGHKHLPDKEAPRLDLTFDLGLVSIMKARSPPTDLKLPPRNAFKIPDGVAIEILTPGCGNEHPTTGSRVKLNYS